MAGRLVGVAVNHAVRLGKETPERTFNVLLQPGSVGEADSVPAKGEDLLLGIPGPDVASAHVAAHRMDDGTVEGLKHREGSQVTGMDDHLAPAETVLDLPGQEAVRSTEMRI